MPYINAREDGRGTASFSTTILVTYMATVMPTLETR